MSLDAILLAVHVLAAVTILTALVTDWIGVLALRGAGTTQQAREGLKALEASAVFGVWGRLASLAAGLTLAVTAWSWEGWIITGIVGWVVLVLLGEPLTGKDLRRMVAGAREAGDELPAGLAARIHDPRLWNSVLTRTGILAALAVCMFGKPGLLTGIALLICGHLAGLAAARLTARHPLSPSGAH
ncbi:hypothetical protein DI272_38145 [Streptomyces sp. Act143]|uniref:hypothetical protein n=1 Tax=Streptomyces sp. Act143 TaxID=2200760 RepID=UPI000D67D89A|nr:hypothetical protein [Streptomyces sp. Act143]PWI19336.1 hypothetical protein DI272_38145 [Streptomyces sp. Act143]